MVTTINILLTSLGLIGTLSAFGGKHGLKEMNQFTRGITKRGYISLTCLSLAFILGVIKKSLIIKILIIKIVKYTT